MASVEKSRVPREEIMYDYRDFFWIPNIIFKSLGYDFMSTSKNRKMRVFLSIVSMLTVGSHIYVNFALIEQAFRFTLKDHLMDVVRLASCIAYSLNSNVKFLVFLIYRKLAHHIYDTLLEAYPKTEEEKKIYRVNNIYWSRTERCVIVLYIVACWNVVFCPLILSINMYLQDNIFPYLKCYPVGYDYDYQTPLRFLGIYLVEMWHSHYMIMGNWGSDLWLVCFTSQICMHLTYIARAIKIYEPQVENAKKDCAFLVELIKRHEIMLSLHDNLNTIFGISLSFNLISTTGVLCIVAVRLIVEGLGLECMMFSIFLVNAVIQFYMICYYGQKLTELSENIATAAYMHNWYNSSAAYKKLLLVLMTRAQKQAKFLAVGLQPISMETFKTFTGSAYQIFALLQTVLDLQF